MAEKVSPPQDRKPIQVLLVANRGEIAVRILRVAKSLGMRTIAVYSQADKDSLHVRLADKAFCIGPAPASKSYLSIDSILAVATSQAVDAIHPGIGFLAENAEFAKRVLAEDILFVGPNPQTIATLGDKIKARETVEKLGIPCIPGSPGSLDNEKEALALARQIGFPVLLKAASGGGGKGMRVVTKEQEFLPLFRLASAEAQKAFSDSRLYLEKYLDNPAHVEVQLIADSYHNVYHIGERDCSLQKDHQKWIEETPSPNIDALTRSALLQASLKLFKSLSYVNAGTIEYLVHEGNFYFMEVNARLQVEHTISEEVGDIDLVRAQLQVTQGELLDFKQSSLKTAKHVLECRINAKAPGCVQSVHFPGGFGVRVDSFLYPHYQVVPFYDALLAKVIVCASERQECIQKMLGVLQETVIEGVLTNLEEQKKILRSEAFQKGSFGIRLFSQIMQDQ